MIKILRGPEGLYGFRYSTPDRKVKSDESFVFLESNVASLKLDPATPPPTTQVVGEPFSVQPRVRVLDRDLKPLQGTRNL